MWSGLCGKCAYLCSCLSLFFLYVCIVILVYTRVMIFVFISECSYLLVFKRMHSIYVLVYQYMSAWCVYIIIVWVYLLNVFLFISALLIYACLTVFKRLYYIYLSVSGCVICSWFSMFEYMIYALMFTSKCAWDMFEFASDCLTCVHFYQCVHVICSFLSVCAWYIHVCQCVNDMFIFVSMHILCVHICQQIKM